MGKVSKPSIGVLVCLALCLLIFAGCAGTRGEPSSLSDPALTEAPASTTESAPAPEAGVTLTTEHVVYFRNVDDLARPEDPLTRAEAADMLYALLEEAPETETVRITDEYRYQWHYPAVQAMVGLGVFTVDGEDRFYPSAPMTRGEFVTVLGKFFVPTAGEVAFPDVAESDEVYPYVANAVASGWVSGHQDGTFRPEEPVTRAQAAAIINRALGREGDASALLRRGGVLYFVDLPDTYWAYGAILEAALPHEYETGDKETWTDFTVPAARHEPGYHLIDNELYKVDDAGHFMRSFTDGVLTFDDMGRYTTGDAELDALLTQAVAENTDPRADRLTNLERLFWYASGEAFMYIDRGYFADGETDWEAEPAKVMLSTHHGNCYNYAAAFTYLARRMGYQARGISGSAQLSPGALYVSHGWVEIETEEGVFFCDPEGQGVYSVNYNLGYYLFMQVYGTERTPAYYKGDTLVDDVSKMQGSQE